MMKIKIEKSVVNTSTKLSKKYTVEEVQESSSFIPPGLEEEITFDLLKESLRSYFFVDIRRFDQSSDLTYDDHRKIRSWIKKNIKGDYRFTSGMALFEKKEDAALFKLIWS